MMTDAESEALNQIGNTAWHSSDEDSGPDVGISVGLGDGMLFVGEVPGLVGGWSMAYYPADGDRVDIAETVNGDEARELIEMLAIKLRQNATALDDLEKARAEVARLREALPDLSSLITWLENGCAITPAVFELRIHQRNISAALSPRDLAR